MRMRSNIRGIGAQKKLQLKRPRFAFACSLAKVVKLILSGRLEPLARFLVARPESQLESNGTASMELAGARQFASLDLDSLKSEG